MTKSSLDQISGIGTAKKAALLKHFGSVKKIGEASVEELMQVKGINENLAKKIKEELLQKIFRKFDIIERLGEKEKTKKKFAIRNLE